MLKTKYKMIIHIIILTVAISAIAAILFPKEEGGKDNEK